MRELVSRIACFVWQFVVDQVKSDRTRKRIRRLLFWGTLAISLLAFYSEPSFYIQAADTASSWAVRVWIGLEGYVCLTHRHKGKLIGLAFCAWEAIRSLVKLDD